MAEPAQRQPTVSVDWGDIPVETTLQKATLKKDAQNLIERVGDIAVEPLKKAVTASVESSSSIIPKASAYAAASSVGPAGGASIGGATEVICNSLKPASVDLSHKGVEHSVTATKSSVTSSVNSSIDWFS